MRCFIGSSNPRSPGLARTRRGRRRALRPAARSRPTSSPPGRRPMRCGAPPRVAWHARLPRVAAGGRVQPYVIRQGDYLAKLAYTFGFDADAVWKDPANADLRKIRSDPNMLWPTDIRYIPDPVVPAGTTLTPGSVNSFVSTSPTVSINLKFTDPERQ